MSDAPHLRSLLAECADDLEAEFRDRYPEHIRLTHPSIQSDYARDMDIVRRVRAALAASDAEPPIIIGKLTLHRIRREVRAQAGNLVQLTANEYDFLELLASAGDATVSRDAVCRAVLGYPRRTRDHAIERLGITLNAKCYRACEEWPVRSVRGVGYRLRCRVVG